MSAIRIRVTAKGETGYLRTQVTLDLRSHYSITLDRELADRFPTATRAARAAAQVRNRFERVEIEEP